MFRSIYSIKFHFIDLNFAISIHLIDLDWVDAKTFQNQLQKIKFIVEIEVWLAFFNKHKDENLKISNWMLYRMIFILWKSLSKLKALNQSSLHEKFLQRTVFKELDTFPHFFIKKKRLKTSYEECVISSINFYCKPQHNIY